MARNPRQLLQNAAWLGLVILGIGGALPARAQYNPDWTRNFRVGLLTGFNIKANFKMTGDFTVSGSQPGVYEDGYVRVDDTGNAQGYTTYWGYENPSQYHGGNILMRDTSHFSTDSHGSQQEDSPYFGFDLVYGGTLWRGERLRVGWDFGFGLLPICITDGSAVNVNLKQDTYAFRVPDGVTIPGAPYHGGPSGYDQPAIEAGGELVGSTTATNGTLSGTRTLDVTLFSFRLGPSLFWDVNRHVGLSLSAGPALGFISGDYTFDETLESDTGTTRNKGGFGVSDVVYGGYVNGTVTFHVTRNGDFYLSAQYMPLGTSTFSEQGREASLDLSGAVYVSAGINWPF